MENTFWSDPTRALYCIVVTHPFPTQKKTFAVIITDNPIAAVVAHNTQTSIATDIHEAAPFCYIERVAGPIYSEENICRFAHEVVQGIRGLDSTIRNLEEMCRTYLISGYSSAMKPSVPLPDYLKQQNMPDEFIDAAMILEQSCNVLLNRS